MCSFVGLGAGVNVGKGVGRVLSEIFMLERLIGLDGIKTHNDIARTTKINPIGRRKLRGWLRREKMRRLYMELL